MNILKAGFRIKQAIGLTGYSVKEFCEKTERSRVTTALWIAGRGGLIKDKSLETLCNDLKKCFVYCPINWLKCGKGPSPTLFLESTSEHTEYNLKLDYLKINSDDTMFHLSKYDTGNYFECNGENFYAIASSENIANLSKMLQSLLLISSKNSQENLGFLMGYCKESSTVVLSTLDNKTLCIDASNIDKIGIVTVFIKKLG
jgi:hypothetical protein